MTCGHIFCQFQIHIICLRDFLVVPVFLLFKILSLLNALLYLHTWHFHCADSDEYKIKVWYFNQVFRETAGFLKLLKIHLNYDLFTIVGTGVKIFGWIYTLHLVFDFNSDCITPMGLSWPNVVLYNIRVETLF